MCNVKELPDTEVFALRNEVIQEAEARIARISLKENLATAIASAEDEAAADAAYQEAKASVFPVASEGGEEESQAPEEEPEQD